MRNLSDFQGFIFDIDGTILKGDTVIPGAKECIDLLIKNNKKYIFVTNHTKFTQNDFIKKLQEFGIVVNNNQLITASSATVEYLKKETPDKKLKVNLIGYGGIVEDFKNAGFVQNEENPDYVVSSWDPDLTYEKLYTACKNVKSGAKFIVTSPDRMIPSERGFEPGYGTIGAMISYATKTDPVYIGKPFSPIIETACKIMETKLEDTIIVGDTQETDMKSKKIAGLGGSVLVLTGNISENEIKNISEEDKPTFILNSVKDFEKYFS